MTNLVLLQSSMQKQKKIWSLGQCFIKLRIYDLTLVIFSIKFGKQVEDTSMVHQILLKVKVL